MHVCSVARLLKLYLTLFACLQFQRVDTIVGDYVNEWEGWNPDTRGVFDLPPRFSHNDIITFVLISEASCCVLFYFTKVGNYFINIYASFHVT